MSPPGQHQQHVMSPPIAPHKGTLAPGTLVQVGKIQVTVKRYLSEGETRADLSRPPTLTHTHTRTPTLRRLCSRLPGRYGSANSATCSSWSCTRRRAYARAETHGCAGQGSAGVC